ncbi:hypothetical protein I4F81_011506 [Pyropia yezoensis]|uniref:Uncharacterized protein n=1 Tax=Pyropia yezoensis TaxID=2788 RepID=A0ACC3CFS5_PYRYE|nr:hypothetical protein I4F81_011506 [Neopyropia yezoensis]
MKNAMAAAKSDNWKVVVVKATNHDPAPPKGKHVRVIMQGLQWGGSITNRESPVGAIFYHLRKRLVQHEWIVVAKSLTIYHHILREGNEKFVLYVANHARGIFQLSSFSDPTPEGFAAAPFIRTYSAYLTQWCAAKAAINFPSASKPKEGGDTDAQRFRTAAAEKLFAELPVLQDSVDRLFGLDLSGQVRFSPVGTPAFSMILRDATSLWVGLSQGMIRLLDLFFKMETPAATLGLDIYRRYIEIVKKAGPFFESARQLNSRWTVPELSLISLDLLDSMTEYVKNGPAEARIEPHRAYQSVAGGYGNMALVPVQQQQGGGMAMGMGGAAGMNPMAMAHAARFGGNPNQYVGGGMQAAAAPAVPAMAAEGPSGGGAAYRVQRGTKPTRVNADDMAFGPLIESLKKSSVSK